MSLESDIHDRLQSVEAATLLLGDRISPGGKIPDDHIVEEDDTALWCAYFITGLKPINETDQLNTSDHVVIQFDIYASEYDEAENAAEAVRAPDKTHWHEACARLG